MDSGTAIIILLDMYEKLLTENQAKILRLHFDEDLSLSEIGELCGISRQAVSDTIQKGRQQLFHYETVLKLAEKEEKIHQTIKLLENNIENPLRIKEGITQLKKIMEEP